ncbi:MAG: PKD domain-containing protein, partial [Caldithrix sp.]|nr:PKD domain-containing protein [Caldithrix sp.]
QNGEITSTEEDNPPEAEFTVSPPAGVVDTQFNFDASPTTDDIDDISNLQFRWDMQSDGTWEVNWTSSTTTTFSYAEKGSYLVTLQAMDSNGLVGSITHRVNIGGGAGTANHIKLFRDNLPWDSNAMTDMLESLGFTEGPGANQYEILTSDQMATAELIPGQDLVIISNDQAQTFYNNYADNQVRFNNFVYTGGSIFWEACDQGWAGGSMANAGLNLPGNLITTFDYDYWNYVPTPDLPLVSGLPTSMDHNYASHESFSGYPDGTIIYCIDESDNPTLLEFNLGGGWVLVTGQPLEHQYDNLYGNSDMEALLPRIVSYFTGQEESISLPKHTPKQSARPSYPGN